jgi:hypothetical protein
MLWLFCFKLESTSRSEIAGSQFLSSARAGDLAPDFHHGKGTAA